MSNTTNRKTKSLPKPNPFTPIAPTPLVPRAVPVPPVDFEKTTQEGVFNSFLDKLSAAKLPRQAKPHETDLQSLIVFRYEPKEWHCLEDIIEEAIRIDASLQDCFNRDTLEIYSHKEAKRYIEAFIEYARDEEIVAVYELLKTHGIMMRNKDIRIK